MANYLENDVSSEGRPAPMNDVEFRLGSLLGELRRDRETGIDWRTLRPFLDFVRRLNQPLPQQGHGARAA